MDFNSKKYFDTEFNDVFAYFLMEQKSEIKSTILNILKTLILHDNKAKKLLIMR